MIDQAARKLIEYLLGKQKNAADNTYLYRGTYGTFALHFIFMALTFFGTWLIARLLGTQEYGKYAYVFNWIAIFAVLGRFGVDDLLIKELPKYRISQQREHAKGVLLYAFKSALFVSIILSVLFFVWVKYSPMQSFTDIRYLFYIAIPVIPCYALSVVVMDALRGNQHILSGQIPEKCIRPIVLAAGAIGAWLIYTDDVSTEILVAVGVAAIMAMFIASVWYFWKKDKHMLQPAIVAKHDSDIWKSTMWYFFLMSAVNVFNSRLDILLVGELSSVDDVGIYNIALRLADFILISIVMLNTVFAPLYSKYHVEGEREKLQQLITRGNRLMFATALPITLLLIIFGAFFLRLFGAGFETGHTALTWIATGQLFYVFIGPAAYILMMTGYGKQAFYVLLVSFTVATMMQIILIPKMGIQGAAIGKVAGLVVGHSLYAVLLYQKAGLRGGIF